MLNDINKFWRANKKQILDARNIVLYLFAVIVLAIAWSTVKTIDNNYNLQKQISLLNQQNTVLELQNQNIGLKNQYFQTDAYLDLAARQNLGLAGPGEQVLLVSKAVALKNLSPNFRQPVSQNTADTRSKYVRNIEAWRDFLLGRKATQY